MIDSNREEFEKLPEVAEILKYVWWNGDRSQYCDTGRHLCSNGAFLNGAWYAFQEQQKKIDDLEEEISILHAGEDY